MARAMIDLNRDSLGGETEPAPDRRRDERFLTVLRVAKLDADGVEGLGIVRNLSGGGMKFEAASCLEVGQTVAISLIDGHPVHGRVIWTKGNEVGINFEQRVAISDVLSKPDDLTQKEKARLPRVKVDRDAAIEIGGTLKPARIHDVSQRGAKLSVPGHSWVRNTDLSVKVGDRTAVRATVRWAEGDFVGVQFHGPVALNELLQWMPDRSER